MNMPPQGTPPGQPGPGQPAPQGAAPQGGHPQAPTPGQAPAPAPHGAPTGDVIYQGIARHSANMGSYLKWIGVCFLGGFAAWGLGKIDAISDWPLWVLTFVGLPGLGWSYLEFVNSKYKITRVRVETEHGVLAKKLDTLELWRVLDVQYTQSLIDRIFGNGRVTLIGTDQSDPELHLHGLPNHRQLFETLRDAVQLVRVCRPLWEAVGGRCPSLAKQLQRAVESVPLNIS